MTDALDPTLDEPQEPDKAPEAAPRPRKARAKKPMPEPRPLPAPPMRVIACLANKKMIETTVRPIAAKDCNDPEFNQFISIARDLALDPLKREIYAFVFNKNDPKKRSMAVVIGLQGYRTMAARQGNYCGDDEPPVIKTDKRKVCPDSNPHGVVHATVYAYKWMFGERQRVAGRVYWDERAPIKESWTQGDDGLYADSGRRYIDKESAWWKQGRHMIGKCAEVEALRKGWPEQFSNVYEESEIERYRVLDLTPSEYADLGRQARLAAVREGPGCMVDWLDGELETHVAYDRMADRLYQFMNLNEADPARVVAWWERNRLSFNEFWKARPRQGYGLKQKFELFQKRLLADSGGHDPDYRVYDVPGGQIMTRSSRPDHEPT